MRLGTLVGIVLVVLGVVGLALGGFSFPPIIGAVAVAGGVLLIAATSRRRR